MQEADGDASAAFQAVTDETRVEILRALADRQRESPHEPGISFSELRRRVGVSDPGNFNYHLDRLRGRLVERTDDGYRLTKVGLQMVGAIAAGTFQPDEGRELATLEHDCPVCGTELAASYDDGFLSVVCENGHTFQNAVSPNAMSHRSLPEAVGLQVLQSQHDVELALEGVCPTCSGPMDGGVTSVEYPELPYVFEATCDHCGMHLDVHVGACVVRHPAVVSFYHEHGIDVRKRPFWTLDFCVDPPTVVSEEPLRLQVATELDGDELRLTVDAAATVVDVERD